MDTLKDRVLVTILSVSLGVAFWIFACAISSTSDMGTTDKNEVSKSEVKQKNIPIQGAITHVHEPDDSSKTIIDIVIGKEFTGKLPEHIDSIAVTGPKGELTLGQSDFRYYPQFRDFWIRIPGAPEPGTYTFTVSSGNRRGSAIDTQSNLRIIPLPDTRTISPVEGETITTKSPHFSWGAVDADVPLYYRIDIKDMKDNYIYRTSYFKDMFSVRLPPDLLQVGETYLWRVRVADGTNWIELNNRSHNQWQKISVGQSQEENVYRYQVPVETADGWQTSSLNEEGVDVEKINELMHCILNGHDEVKNVHSVLLVKNGKLVLEEYFYGSHQNHMHHIQSDTKSITSILVGIAYDREILPSLDKNVYEFFPEYRGTKWIDQKYEIKLKDVLTMTAGLNWDEKTLPFSNPRNDIVAMNQSNNWIKYVLDKDTIEPPGKRFNYNGGLTILLGGVIKNTSGLYVDKFAEEYLFGPLSISEYYWYKHPDGTIHTGGGLHLRSRDMAKIGYLMLNDGKWEGKQIVSKEWVHESTKAHVSTGGHRYGYQWWRGKTIKNNQVIDAFWAWGHGGQFIFVLPEMDLVVVFTAKPRENPGYSERAFNMLTNFIIPAVMPPGPPREIAKVDVKVLETYVGTYRFKHNGETETVNIFLKDNRLYGRGDDEEIAELLPETENQFFVTSKDIGDFKLKFVKDQKGDIMRFLLNFSPQFSYLSIAFDKINP